MSSPSKLSETVESKAPGLAAALSSGMPDTSGKAPHIVVTALAGTGKTTTLVEGLKQLFGQQSSLTPSPQQKAVWDSIALSKGAQSVCFVAFNRSIAKELKDRVPPGAQASTMHAMGLKAVTNAFGKLEVVEYRTWDLIASILGKDIRELRRDKFEVLSNTAKLVGLCKNNLVGTDTVAQMSPGDWIPDTESFQEALDVLCSHYELDLNGTRAEVYDLVPKVIERSLNPLNDGRIDYDDMVWLPAVLGIPVTKYDLLLVDECQDLNRCQQTLALKAGKRLVLCGDGHQAIYGFAGADAESMARMIRELGATERGVEVLPLTVTRRCGKAIVAEAQAYVADFEAHESNGPGAIYHALFTEVEPGSERIVQDGFNAPAKHTGSMTYHSMVQSGDMVLCRVNAPLVSQCFRFLKAGRKANIQGRDVGQGLISTIRKLHAADVPDLVGKLSDWLHQEEEKENRKRIPSEARLIALQDRHDCIIAFCDGETMITGVIERIERVFTDTPGFGIRLSTIHKAKGLEAKRVFLLEPEGATVPHPMAKSTWQKGQEFNLRYVAITRAIEELVYVK